MVVFTDGRRPVVVLERIFIGHQCYYKQLLILIVN